MYPHSALIRVKGKIRDKRRDKHKDSKWLRVNKWGKDKGKASTTKTF